MHTPTPTPAGGPPAHLDVHWELRNGVCQRGVQDVVGHALKQRVQPLLPTVQGLGGGEK